MSIIGGKLSGRALSAGTLNLYESNLKRLNGGEPIKNLNFLKKTDSIINDIKTKKPTTARSYVIAICSILKSDPKFKKEFWVFVEFASGYRMGAKCDPHTLIKIVDGETVIIKKDDI